MSNYTSMLIDALLIGFLLFTLIHGSLSTYIAFAGPSMSGVATNSAIPTLASFVSKTE